MAIPQSIAQGDKVVYTGPSGAGVPDSGSVGVLDRIEFPPGATAGTPADFVVSFPEGQLKLSGLLFEKYDGRSTGKLWWILGACVAGAAGYMLYKKHKADSDEHAYDYDYAHY